MTSFRRILGVAILIAVPWTAFVWADVPCFEDTKNVECPGTKVTGACGDQFADFGINDGGAWIANCNNGTMYVIGTGIFKDSCLTIVEETGSHCEPKVDKNKMAIQVICAWKYKCKYDKVKNECVKGDYIDGGQVYAVSYGLTTNGCRPLTKKRQD
jgi:hypothetical protein